MVKRMPPIRLRTTAFNIALLFVFSLALVAVASAVVCRVGGEVAGKCQEIFQRLVPAPLLIYRSSSVLDWLPVAAKCDASGILSTFLVKVIPLGALCEESTLQKNCDIMSIRRVCNKEGWSGLFAGRSIGKVGELCATSGSLFL